MAADDLEMRTRGPWLSLSAAAFVVTIAATAWLPLRAQEPELKILSPGEDAYLSGPTMLRARVTPPGAALGVTFFVDGRQVCALTREPFECDWDAGPSIAEHQVRAVATLAAGGRIVHTVRTKGIGYNE